MRPGKSSWLVACALAFAVVFLTIAETAGEARADEGSAPVPSTSDKVLYGLSAQARGIFVPAALLTGFLKVGNGVQQGSIGASFFRRKGTLEVVVSLDYGWYSPQDGNFLSASSDKTAMLDTHYVHFDNLGVLSADVSFYYTSDVHKYVAVTVGAGLGMGVVLGNVYVVNNSETVCTDANAADPSKCYPVVDPNQYKAYGNPPPTYVNSMGQTVELSGAIKPGDPQYQAKMNGLQAAYASCMTSTAGDCRDTSKHPYYHKENMIPVVPVINFQLGLKFKIHRHFNLNVTGGFRNGLIIGGGPEVVF